MLIGIASILSGALMMLVVSLQFIRISRSAYRLHQQRALERRRREAIIPVAVERLAPFAASADAQPAWIRPVVEVQAA